VSVRGLAHAYGEVRALAGIDLEARAGELVAVVGPSGAGKTTLLELICGWRRPGAGTIACAPAVLMPQRDLLLEHMSALDNAALPLRLAGTPRAHARARAAALFGQLGLEGFEGAAPASLSAGMRQRVALLRTLLAGRPVVCLDEPFAALDAITRAQAQRWLESALGSERRTTLLVTHDAEEAVLLADRVAVLSPRPGRVLALIEVTLPRPRERTDPALVRLREQALAALAGGMGAALA
jgi:ABC-type nitrate/sulfonate/bicarbonate transport system ATPase subunit